MSTAFFRMMLERGDFYAVHEPFNYLAEFGTVSVAGSTVTSEAALLARLRELGEHHPVFFKDTPTCTIRRFSPTPPSWPPTPCTPS
jgi:hypothetical protein